MAAHSCSEYDIVLDRRDAAYYPGDVVSGRVVITTTSATRCGERTSVAVSGTHARTSRRWTSCASISCDGAFGTTNHLPLYHHRRRNLSSNAPAAHVLAQCFTTQGFGSVLHAPCRFSSEHDTKSGHGFETHIPLSSLRV